MRYWVVVMSSNADLFIRHDVGIQIVGQPARDLARHFVQRYQHFMPVTWIFDLCIMKVELSFKNQGKLFAGVRDDVNHIQFRTIHVLCPF